MHRRSSFRLWQRLLFVVALAMAGATRAFAQAPPGYYDPVDTSNGTALRSTLHGVIDDHLRFPYTSSATDTWNILESADEDASNPSNIRDVYRNESFTKFGGGNSFYNREHTWPKSYGFPDDGSSNYPYTDCHHLFLCDDGYNSSRSNKPFRYCDASCSEKVTVAGGGQGGGSGSYPGNSNWTSGSFTSGSWEVWGARRGDVARAMFYMDLRYEGGNHGVTGHSEPDLILTDSESLIGSSNTGNNESVGYMGMLSVLLQWHVEDPVDAAEVLRNDVVFSFQGNRNPFVDHPEWVECIWGSVCGGAVPASPTGLFASAGDGFVDLDWFDNTEGDLAGYNVLRATSSGGPYNQLNSALVVGSAYSDNSAQNGTTYYYVVTAENTTGGESAASAEVSATPQAAGGGTGTPWINEFHYDNASSDVGEFVEVAGPAGLSLGGWQLVGYNGNGGAPYKTVNLSGTLPDQGGCVGSLSFSFSGLQNGAPDGIALVDDAGALIEFLSYEGTIVGSSGAAAGQTSTDVGVSESGSTPAGHSLQRGGSGSAATDFSWQSAQVDTPGSVNAGQIFQGGCGGGGPTPPAAPSGLVANGGNGQVNLNWNANGEGDLDGYDVHRATSSGGPYQRLNGSLLASAAYTDSSVTNGVTYFYVVTAWNTSAQESANSAEVSATPASPPGWTVLTEDDFESGWGNYVDGGSDCRRYTGGTHAPGGNAAANIQDNRGVYSSFTHGSGIDVQAYTQLRVEFRFKAVSMDNSNEDFWLQYYDGSSWNIVETWARGTDFDNNVVYDEEVLIDSSSYAFPSDMKLRFTCDASGNADDVYIDDIVVSGQ